ncbi:hypothetical protein ACE1B6_22670 [Aerosakkonemataceae cyanobacterium BLCC-F154]|uniref:Uncharacterized protein n=1 Tax=Floridaenema fluviatile BLCC-F154 TaxID=3153640 RepID=A0ABV4YGU9_9CYAN
MSGKDAYCTVKLLMRKHIKSVKDHPHLLAEQKDKYTNLLWTYNFLNIFLRSNEEFIPSCIDELNDRSLDHSSPDPSFDEGRFFSESDAVPYWEIVRDIDLGILNGYLDYWNLVEELIITDQSNEDDLNKHFKVLKYILNEVIASDCFSERYKGRLEERFIQLWDKRLFFAAQRKLAALAVNFSHIQFQ